MNAVEYNENTELSPQQLSALSLYEQGAKEESHGRLKDAIMFYARAIKSYEYVERLYRKKLQYEYEQKVKERDLHHIKNGLKDLDIEDGDGETQQKEGEEEEVEEIEPCWLLEILSDDILVEIVNILALLDPSAHVNLSSTCHRLSKISFTSSTYRTLCKAIYPSQIYSSTAIQLNNISNNQEEMVRNWDFNWELMLNDRPYLKFCGVYIARVNYISEGAKETSFFAPVKLVTYFRYLRFYKDGTVLKLITTDEPKVIVPQFDKPNQSHFNNCNISRFTLELDGHLLLNRRDDKYEYIEELRISSLGDRKYHRLGWVQSFYQDEQGDRRYFCMAKENPYNFSGVKHIKEEYLEKERKEAEERYGKRLEGSTD